MTGKLDRTEIKEMIEEAIERKLTATFEDSLEKWMDKYGLRPQHWVFLEAEYSKTMSRQSLIRRVILTAIVTSVSMATLWGAEDWIKKVVIDASRKTERSTHTNK